MSDRLRNAAKELVKSKTAQKALKDVLSGSLFKKSKVQTDVKYETFTVFIPGNSPDTATGTTHSVRLPLDELGNPITHSLPIGARLHPRSDPDNLQPSIQYRSYFEDTVRKDHKLPEVFAHCQKAYEAVGRIGARQSGEPTGKERVCGTGILISDQFILTNHHVFAGYLRNPLEEFGIEFGAEKGSKFTDFARLDDSSVIPIPKYDAVLMRLQSPITHRQPITLARRKLNSLEQQEIMVIGYPSSRSDMRPNLILATKRYSLGKIFRHSTDHSKYLTVPYSAHPIVGDDVTMEVVCHNASTLPGNSGSAVIDQKTGELIALHFGSDYSYRNGESANFAIPGEKIAKKIRKLVRKHS